MEKTPFYHRTHDSYYTTFTAYVDEKLADELSTIFTEIEIGLVIDSFFLATASDLVASLVNGRRIDLVGLNSIANCKLPIYTALNDCLKPLPARQRRRFEEEDRGSFEHLVLAFKHIHKNLPK